MGFDCDTINRKYIYLKKGKKDFQSDHKGVTSILIKTGCHAEAIDHIHPCYEVKLVKVPIPVFSSDDKLSWGQTEWSLNQYLHLQHENNLGREMVRKKKPIIFQLSFPLCKGKSITCWTPYSVHLGNYNLSSQYVHAEWLMMVNKQHIQKLSLLPSSWLTHWNSTFQKVQEPNENKCIFPFHARTIL